MPFNDTTKRVEALWRFVDAFQAGGSANRSDFDQYLSDFETAVNEAIAYLESILPSSTITDDRYCGRVDTPPTARLSGGALQPGDYYINSSLVRTNVIYVWTGAAWAAANDFPSIQDYWVGLAATVTDAPTMRGLLELGSAALQNASAFAPASVADAIGLALVLGDANGLGVTITDWNTAHAEGAGFFAANAAATNGPAAVALSGVYIPTDANAGFIIAAAPSTGNLYWRIRSAGAWASSWIRLPQRSTLISGVSVDTVLPPADAGVDFYRIGASVTGLPSGAGEGDLLIAYGYDANDGAQLILTRDRRFFIRGQVAGSNNAWDEFLRAGSMPMTKKFVSTEQTITAAGLLTLAHGLGVAPSLIFGHIVCQTAELGYSISDKVMISLISNGTTGENRVNAVYFDTTNVYVRFSNNSPFTVAHKTTGVASTPSTANWKLVITAFA